MPPCLAKPGLDVASDRRMDHAPVVVFTSVGNPLRLDLSVRSWLAHCRGNHDGIYFLCHAHDRREQVAFKLFECDYPAAPVVIADDIAPALMQLCGSERPILLVSEWSLLSRVMELDELVASVSMQGVTRLGTAKGSLRQGDAVLVPSALLAPIAASPLSVESLWSAIDELPQVQVPPGESFFEIIHSTWHQGQRLDHDLALANVIYGRRAVVKELSPGDDEEAWVNVTLVRPIGAEVHAPLPVL